MTTATINSNAIGPNLAPPPSPMRPQNVIQALAAVAREVGAITKDRQVQHGDRFKYRGIDDVLNALHEPLSRHGVVIVPRKTVLERIQRSEYGSRDGKPSAWFEERGLVQYRVYGPAGTQDYIDVEVPTSALDNSDKATGKVLSYAFKSLAFQLFTIPTDNSIDNESDDGRRGPRGEVEPTEEDIALQVQTDELRTEVIGRGSALHQEAKDALKAWANANGFGYKAKHHLEQIKAKLPEFEKESDILKGEAEAPVDPDAPIDLVPAEYPEIQRAPEPEADKPADEAAPAKDGPATRARQGVGTVSKEQMLACYAWVTGRKGATVADCTTEQSKEAVKMMRLLKNGTRVVDSDGLIADPETGETVPSPGASDAEAA